MLRWLPLILVISASSAFAQVVTSSFDRTVLSRNPAAATTRNYSQFALFEELRKTDSKDTNDGGIPFKQNVTVNKTGLYVTGHGRFTPELYVSKDDGEMKLKISGFNDQKASSSMVNNQVNLGFRLTTNIAIGLKFYKPSINYKTKVSFTDAGNTTQVVQDTKASYTGVGGGITLRMTQTIYLGGFYIKETENSKINQTVTTNGTPSQDDQKVNESLAHSGFGLSYLDGHRGNGARAELSYARKQYNKLVDRPAGEQIGAAAEYSGRLFTGGVSVKFRKNGYYDNLEFMNVIVGDQVFSSKFEPSLGGFLSFGHSKGHTFGVSGLIYSSEGKRDFFGAGDQVVKSKYTQLTVNYAYLF